jgi:putative ABC transport system substrate-binding protein
LAILLGSVLLAGPLAAPGQNATKPWRVGVLETISPALNAANFDALRAGLRDLGYIEGQNLVIEYRSADGVEDRFPALATDLFHSRVDVIVTRGTPAAVAAKSATAALPIVMAASGDPVASGVVRELARPGGNVTGLSADTNELIGKRIEPILLDVRTGDELATAFASISQNRVDAVVVGNDTVTHANRRQLVDLAALHRVPAVYATKEFVEAGGLMVYAVDYADLCRRAATFVDKIFKGAKPADLPVEQPTKFELIVNLKTARALGLTIPQSILARADEVIE